MEKELLEKLNKLKKILSEYGSVLVAYSGGVDSSVLMGVAVEVLGKNAHAAMIVSNLIPKYAVEEAREFAGECGFTIHELQMDIAKKSEVYANGKKRCYYCKQEVIALLKNEAHRLSSSSILFGENIDDDNAYRPGQVAVKEGGAFTPFKDAGITKKDIRSIADFYNWSVAQKPASACLASRIPYDTKLTKAILARVENAENILRVELGIKQFRVRAHNELASIEVMKNDFPIILNNIEMIKQHFNKFGFTHTTLDLSGFRSGSLDEE